MLKKLYLQHFRNYTQAEISFSPRVNWFSGKNAQGKTNLLEAIYLLSCGRSFRTLQLNQLIQTGAGYFYIQAEIEEESVDQTIKLSYDGENKKVQYNSTTYSHFNPLIGIMPSVLYGPEDIVLASGAPASRRRFLDLHLSQIDPLYLHHLARYHKAMRQRNELLKKKSEDAIEPWEDVMARSAYYLMQKRNQFIQEIKEELSGTMAYLSSDRDHLTVEYQSSLPQESSQQLLVLYAKNRKKELHVGTTLYGVHRDDLQFSINNLSVKTYASEGQKHSVVAALKLCSFYHLKKLSKTCPLFCVDDFGSHLDRDRQARFEEKLQSCGQIFLTSPAASLEIFPDKQIINIESGKVLEISKAQRK